MTTSIATDRTVKHLVLASLAFAMTACGSSSSSEGYPYTGDPPDTAQWRSTPNVAPVMTGGNRTVTEYVLQDDEALTINSNGSVSFTVTATETFDVAQATITQENTCTRTINGILDDPFSSPTCEVDSEIYDLDETYSFSTTIEGTTDNIDTASRDYDLRNPLNYTDAEIYNDGFQDPNVANPGSNGYGYDVVDFDDADQRFLISNLGRGTLFDGFVNTPTPGWWYDSNGNDTYETGTDTLIAQPSATDYTNLGSHEADVRAAHNSGWNGRGVSIYLPATGIITEAERNQLANVAPGATQAASNTPLARVFYVSVGNGVAIDTDSTAIFDCSSSVVCDEVLTDVGRVGVDTDADSGLDIIDDAVTVAGAAALISHKFNGLSGRQIAHIIVATRGANRELRIAEALSPVGNLE